MTDIKEAKKKSVALTPKQADLKETIKVFLSKKTQQLTLRTVWIFQIMLKLVMRLQHPL